MSTAAASATQKHLLVVDDDRALRDLLQRYLSENGFTVTTVNDGTEMARELEVRTFDLVILDLMLPGKDGLTLTRQLRQQGDVPVIMLSAKGDDVDRIVGLEIGADDYLAKPFNARELLARIRSLLRRSRGRAIQRSNQYTFAHFRVDLTTRELFSDDQRVELTAGEFMLLKTFIEHPETALSRDQLTHKLKGYERHPSDRSIDVQVTRLRKKLEPDPAKPLFIRTLWGEGYMFTPGGQGS